MPRKDQDEYNAYMKDFMFKKRAKEKMLRGDKDVKINKSKDGKKRAVKASSKTEPVESDDFDGSVAPVLDINSDGVNDLVGMGRDLLTDKDTGKPDKIFDLIEKGQKYLPIAVKLVQGFIENYKAWSAENPAANQQPQQDQQARIQAPDGWTSLSPMQRINYKYKRAAWYAAGLRYDEMKESGEMNPAINTGYVDPTYSHAAAQRRGQQAAVPGSESSAPKNLKDLSRKYAEAPLVKDGVEQESVIGETQPQPQPKHDPKMEQIIKDKQKKHCPGKDEDKIEGSKEVEIMKTLQKDNAKYVNMAVMKINEMDMKKFKIEINDIDKLIGRHSFAIAMMPIQLTDMLKMTSDDEILALFKEECTDKYSWCEKNKKIDDIKMMFADLRSKI